MAEMGSYCKAFLAKDLRAFPGFSEDPAAIRPRAEGEDGASPDGLGDDAILYLQETFVVTDGIFIDENVVFSDVTPEWKAFCTGELGFEVPDDAVAAAPAGEGA